ncbi:MAG TPA: AI-2E family transporter [Candidatus Binatia bacterium]|nr:AI-2E family transporter [Candidatus Binatia bacterium]
MHPTDDARTVRLATAIAFRASIVVIFVAFVAWWIYLVRDVLALGLLAAIIAAAIHAPVEALEHRGVRRVLAVIVVYLAVIVVVGVLLALLVPPLVNEAREFAQDLPALIGQLSTEINALLAQLGLSTSGSLVDTILGSLGSLGGILARVPGVIVGFLSALLLVTFLSALMILERDRARTWTMRFVAPPDRPTLDALLRKAAERLGAYVRGQLLIMGVTGVGSYVGLTLIGVPFALPLAIFAFLTEAIPIAGPLISGLVMIVVAFAEGPLQGLLAVALVVVIQQAESLVLVPVIQGRLISISPVVALLAVLAGSAIGDIPGAILAIPVVAIIMVVVDDVILPWRRREIGDDDARPPTAVLDEPAAPPTVPEGTGP